MAWTRSSRPAWLRPTPPSRSSSSRKRRYLGANAGDNDYDEPSTTSVTIKAGDTIGDREAPIMGDSVHERHESITATFARQGTVVSNSTDTVYTPWVTIRNDDAQPTMTFGQFSGLEGWTATVNGTIVGSSETRTTWASRSPARATLGHCGHGLHSAGDLVTTTVIIPQGFTGSLADRTTPSTDPPSRWRTTQSTSRPRRSVLRRAR